MCNEKKPIKLSITAVIILFLALCFLFVNLNEEIAVCVRWTLMILAVSLIIRPLFSYNNLSLCDSGFSLSFGLSAGILFVFVFIICVIFRVPLNNTTSVLFFLVAGLATFLASNKSKNSSKMFFSSREEAYKYLVGFFVYFFVFLIAVWIKGFKPGIDFQTEQYMDYGFMQAIYRQEILPPEDIWLSGNPLNYYYLGQALATFLCRLAFVSPEYGYNLMLCTVFASMVMTTFTVLEAFIKSFTGISKRNRIIGGLCGMFMTTLGGNGHWILYGVCKRLAGLIIHDDEAKHYWFPDSTVFIGVNPDTMDKAKHEFPSYTIVLGDLHAHVINMLFTIPLIGVLFDYAVLCTKPDTDKYKYTDEDGRINFKQVIAAIMDPHIIILAALLALYKGVNYWDFPIYFVVSGAVVLFCDVRRYGFSIINVTVVLLKGAFIIVSGFILMLPFNMHFEKMMSGICFCKNHSPIYKFLIIWGVHLVIVLTLISVFVCCIKSGKRQFKANELTVIALAMCGIGLLLVPEIIYIKDIYGEPYLRYNTMFKLTYQGFILLGLCSGMCISVLLSFDRRIKKKYLILNGLGLVYSITALLLAGYLFTSVKSWFGNVFNDKERKGISAVASTLDLEDYDNVREMIALINHDNRNNIRIIEEAANSYSPESKISVMTGAPTVIGWYVHEWMWHNDNTEVILRNTEVSNFYSLGNTDYCKSILDKYDINYICVTPKVTEKYDVNYSGFISLGECIYLSDTKEYMLIKVK